MRPPSRSQGTVSVGDLFQNRFVIAGYQRPYDWGRKQVVQLASDLVDHARACANSPESARDHYLLNSMLTTVRDSGRQVEIIDGQQRLTTLLILFAVIRDSCAPQLGNGPWMQTLSNCVAVYSAGIAKSRIEVEHAPRDVEDFFSALAIGEEPAEPDLLSTAFDLQNAYKELTEWVKGTFLDPPEPDSLLLFLGVVQKHTHVAEVRVASSAVAWQAFERANDRGLPLSTSDLVKSSLFNSALGDAERDAIAEHWRDIIVELHSIPGKPGVDTFLHHLLLADFATKKIPKTAVKSTFESLLQNPEPKTPDGYKVGSKDPAVAICEYLKRGAKAYANICQGKSPNGDTCVALADLHRVPRFKRALTQYRQVLMAARGAEDFNSVVEQVQRLVVVLTLTAEYGTAAQEIFDLAKSLRENWTANPKVDIGGITRGYVDDHLTEDRKHNFRRALSRGGVDEWSREAAQYMLARIENWTRQSFESSGRASLSRLNPMQGDVEHILPQSLPQDATREFGCDETHSRGLVDRMGNLTIWEPKQNSAAGNKPYSNKRRAYEESQYYITQAISKKLVGTKALEKASKQLGYFPQWDESSLKDRHGRLSGILYELFIGQKADQPIVLEIPDTSDLQIQISQMPAVKNIMPAVGIFASGVQQLEDVASEMGHRTLGPAAECAKLLTEIGLIEEDEDGTYSLTEDGRLILSADSASWEAQIKKLILDKRLWTAVADSSVTATGDNAYRRKDVEKVVKWARNDAPATALSPKLAKESKSKRKQATRRSSESTKKGKAVSVLLENNAIPAGAQLTINLKTTDSGSPSAPMLTRATYEMLARWVAENPARGRATWLPQANCLRWEVDGQEYSPTGLAKHIYRQACHGERSIRGTSWWLTPSGETLNELADRYR